MVGGRAGANSTLSVNYALTGGDTGDTVPKAGDTVYIEVVTGTAGRTPACQITTPAGFAAYGQLNANGTTFDTSMDVSRKRMGATPDTAFTLPSTGNTADAQSYTVRVYRGVAPGNPDDVTSTTATGTGTSRPDPPSITPSTAGAWPVIFGAGAAGTGANYTFTDLTDVLTRFDADTNDSVVGSGHKENWTSGAFNAAVSTTGSAVAADSWAARAIVLRPAKAISTLTENFEAALDTNKWTEFNTNGTVNFTGGVGEFALTSAGAANKAQIISDGADYSILNSTCFVKIPQAARDAGSTGNLQTYITIEGDTGGGPQWLIFANGNVVCAKPGAGLATPTTDYWNNQDTFRWLGYKEDNGTFYWRSAPESASNPPIESDWVNRHSVATNTLGNGVFENNYVSLFIWTDPATTVTQIAKFDGLNTAASVSGAVTNSTADPGSYVVSGVAATAVKNRAANAESGSYSLTGVAATGVVVPPAVVTDSDAQPGTYALTGVAATGVRNVAAIASAGTYALTGEAATGNKGFAANTLPGTYSYSGTASAYQITRGANTQPGSYSQVGESTFDFVENIEGESPGAYQQNGNPATANIIRAANTQAGSYSLNGAQAFGYVHFNSVADPGDYALVGVDAEGVIESYIVSVADPGAYDLVGVNAKSSATYSVNAEAGSYAQEGAADATEQSTLVEGGSYVLEGVAAWAYHDRVSVADSGEYGIDGYDAYGGAQINSLASFGEYGLTGANSFGAIFKIIFSDAMAGSYETSGTSTRAIQSLSSVADPGLYFLNGLPAFGRISGEGVAGGTSKIIVKTRTVTKTVPGKPSQESILSAQRTGLIEAPPAPTQAPAPPAIIEPAPTVVPVARPMATGGAVLPARPSESPVGATLSDVATALAEVQRLTSELRNRDKQIEELEDAVGVAFAAGMMAGDDG